MLDLSAAIQAHLNQRGARHVHLLTWIDARDRNTGATQGIGFWTGGDHEDFQIDGQSRTFFGAGTLLKMNPLVVETGVKVRQQRLVFSSVAPEVQLATKGYETRAAPVRIFVAFFDPITRQMIDAPVRRFKGRVAGLDFKKDPHKPGKKSSGAAQAELTLQSSAFKLTQTLSLKKSDEALQARAPGDRIRRYTDVSGAVETVWGELRAKAPESSGPGEDTPPRRTEFEGR